MNKYIILYRGGEDYKGRDIIEGNSFGIYYYNDPTEHELNQFYQPKIIDLNKYTREGQEITEWKVIVSSHYSDDYFYIHKYTAIQIGE